MGAHGTSSVLSYVAAVRMKPCWWPGDSGREPLPCSHLLVLGSSLAATPPGVGRWRVRVENPTSRVKASILFLGMLGEPSEGPGSCPVCSRDATLLCLRLVRLGRGASEAVTTRPVPNFNTCYFIFYTASIHAQDSTTLSNEILVSHEICIPRLFLSVLHPRVVGGCSGQSVRSAGSLLGAASRVTEGTASYS